MKRFIQKLGLVTTYLVIIFGVIWSLISFLYGVLPAETTQPIIDSLKMNSGAIIPSGISTFVITTCIYIAKLLSKTLNLKLKDSNLERQLWQRNLEEKINEEFKVREATDTVVINRQNEIIETVNKFNELMTVMIAFNKANADRNIASSLVPDNIKEEYNKAIKLYQNLPDEIKPIVTVYEEVVIKEVIKEIEKPKENLNSSIDSRL